MVCPRSAGLILLMSFAPSLLASAQPWFIIRRPTVIAFFPPVTQKQLEQDPDTNESLADFQIYAKQARERLAKMGVELKEVYARSFRVSMGGKVTTFRPGSQDVGYYLIAPGKTPRIVYGVQADTDLVQLAAKYFGTPEP